MHLIGKKAASIERCLPRDVWAPLIDELESLAQAVIEPSSRPWVRRGSEWAIAGQSQYGAQAKKLGEEFTTLSKESKSIREGAVEEASLMAAAYFHLRFERIHPLRNGNGRVGRILMAAQCAQAYSIPFGELVSGLDQYAVDYRRVHAPMGESPQPAAIRFELLVDLLARILGRPIMGEVKLPFSIDPRYPEKRFRTVHSCLQKR